MQRATQLRVVGRSLMRTALAARDAVQQAAASARASRLCVLLPNTMFLIIEMMLNTLDACASLTDMCTQRARILKTRAFSLHLRNKRMGWVGLRRDRRVELSRRRKQQPEEGR